jgi:hypothetical protein
MDNFIYESASDNVTLADTGLPGGAALDKIGSKLKSLRVGIVNKAKAKKAKKISDGGGYWGLTSFQKSLINIPQYVLDQVGGQGISEKMVEQMPKWQSTPTIADIKAVDAKIKGTNKISDTGIIGVSEPLAAAAEKNLTPMDYKKYIPYVIGVVVLAVVIFFVVKKK